MSSNNSSSNTSSDTISIENNKADDAQNQIQTSSTQAQQHQPEQKGFLGSLTSLAPMVLIFVVFYFFLIRPQEKKRKLQEELIKTVKKGEEIITNSGMYGVVSKVSDDGTIEVEFSKGVSVKISKAAVADILSRKKEAKSTSK